MQLDSRETRWNTRRSMLASDSLESQVHAGRNSSVICGEELDKRVLAHAITNSEAAQRFARGECDRAAAIAFAREYYPVCLQFPLFLAAAISHVSDEDTRLLLVANLYEEHGNLDATRTHPELFRGYIRSLDLSPEALADGGSVGARLAQRFRTVCQEGPDYRAAAILYAFEALFSPACALIAEGLRRMGMSDTAVTFFDVHAIADVSHAAQLRTSVAAACRSRREWEVAVATADEGGRLLYELFDFAAATSS